MQVGSYVMYRDKYKRKGIVTKVIEREGEPLRVRVVDIYWDCNEQRYCTKPLRTDGYAAWWSELNYTPARELTVAGVKYLVTVKGNIINTKTGLTVSNTVLF